MASPNDINQLLGLGSIAGLGQQQSGLQGGFGTARQVAEQQMHAQQQMNEITRHMLDAQRYAMMPQKIFRDDMLKPWDEGKPYKRPLTIREELQKEINEWLAPLNL